MLSLLHTADWQIGRLPTQAEPDDANALYEARLDVVRRLAQLAREHAVDAVLVAGDVFDAQTVSDKTVRRLFGAMDAYDGPWLLLPGNHDAALGESVWRRAQRLGVVRPGHRLCLAPESLVIDGKFQLLTAPLMQRHTHHDLTAWFDDAPGIDALPRIGLAHGSVQGVLPDGIDSPNPIAAQRASTARLDYLALGDWHGTRRIDERTWYAGTPETDRFRANDSGHALLVRLTAPGSPPQVQALRTGRYRWRTFEPAIRVDSDVDALIDGLGQLDSNDVALVRPTGRCDVAAFSRLNAAVDTARATARALMDDLASLRVEPTDRDIEALHADGYVGEVLQSRGGRQQARREATAESDGCDGDKHDKHNERQAGQNDRGATGGDIDGDRDDIDDEARTARDALLLLTGVLDSLHGAGR